MEISDHIYPKNEAEIFFLDIYFYVTIQQNASITSTVIADQRILQRQWLRIQK